MDQTNRTRAQQAVRLLMLTDRLHRAAIEAQTDKLGIHRSQHYLLTVLARRGGELTQTQTAKLLDISPAAVTVTLQKLEKSGLIERQTAENDARTKIIRLTDCGRETVKKAYEMFLTVDDTMCGGMTDTELDSLCASLSKMADNLKAAGHKDPCCGEKEDDR
jgi:DNA-binding MarR family transcriptional regulator